MRAGTKQPLIAHVIHRLAVGGMENGLANLINNMPKDKYRHAVICMDRYTDFRFRIKRDDVNYYALHKQPGHDVAVYFRLLKVLRSLKPAIIHTRNIGTLECMLPAKLLGITGRIHGEHGRDMTDIDGSNKKYILLRKAIRPLVHQYVSVSKDLQQWLLGTIGVKPQRVTQIYNGVDTQKFHPPRNGRQKLPAQWGNDESQIVIGTVGRLQGEKDQITLIKTFHQLLKDAKESNKLLRLVIVGEGPLRDQLVKTVQELGIEESIWLAGSRDDLPDLYRGLDIFVLPSLGEGISNTILEAMASGLPVIATNVGGNPELVDNGKTGLLIPPASVDELKTALTRYLDEPGLINEHGKNGRQKTESFFSIDTMVAQYLSVYDSVLCDK